MKRYLIHPHHINVSFMIAINAIQHTDRLLEFRIVVIVAQEYPDALSQAPQPPLKRFIMCASKLCHPCINSGAARHQQSFQGIPPCFVAAVNFNPRARDGRD
ncbi:MAG: hypothetical protein LBT81_01850, partial [Helicobacteraceae bacterium]|nr:hypothetical protein [Helicobacteraceae bacterium]